MAISPPSDIVLDVARAAEPTAVASARAELLRKSQAASAAPFEPFEQPVGTSSSTRAGDAAGPSSPTLSRTASPGELSETSKKFEAMVLQTFISAMMPQNVESTYGEGIAGDMWKSMMAEKVADVVAERGGIGIADQILGDFHMEGDKKVPVAGVTPEAQLTGGGQPQMIATAFVDLVQRQLASEIGVEATATDTGLFKE